jgi:hypothetical protein
MSLKSSEHTVSGRALEEHQVCLPGDFYSLYNVILQHITGRYGIANDDS